PTCERSAPLEHVRDPEREAVDDERLLAGHRLDRGRELERLFDNRPLRRRSARCAAMRVAISSSSASPVARYVTAAPDSEASRSATVDLPLRAPPNRTTRLTRRDSRARARRRAPTPARRRRARRRDSALRS